MSAKQNRPQRPKVIFIRPPAVIAGLMLNIQAKAKDEAYLAQNAEKELFSWFVIKAERGEKECVA